MTPIKYLFLIAISFLFSACGGSSGSPGTTQPMIGAAPTALSSAGKITGFGSIYVNGIEFETDSASYEIDDEVGTGDSDLSVGMFVKVKGTVNSDGVTGTAESVSYDDEIEGPVANLMPDPTDSSQKTFTIFNAPVVIGPGTVFEAEDGSAFDINSIMDGDNVEVSGEYRGDILFASYVEKQGPGDDEYEVEGTISAFDGVDRFTLAQNNGATLNITLAAGATIPSAGISDGQYVEVEGTIPDPVGAPIDLLASSVELEDDDYFDADDDEVEIKGPLTLNDDGSWTINSTIIEFGPSTVYEPASLADAIADGSASGRVVEVEGSYVDGVLQADKVQDEEDDVEFKAFVDAVSATDAKNGTITVVFTGASGGSDGNGRLDVIVSGETLYMDDDAASPFDITTLPLASSIEIHAFMDDTGSLLASSLEIEDDTGTEMEAPVDAIDDTSITVLGIVFSVGAETTFVNGTPVAGDEVSVEDSNADGTADIVEIDD